MQAAFVFSLRQVEFGHTPILAACLDEVVSSLFIVTW